MEFFKWLAIRRRKRHKIANSDVFALGCKLLRLQLFGSPAIVVGERRLAHPSKKVMALLAYLASRADEPVSRSHLAALLWADSAEEQSRANLRQALSQLKKLFQLAGQN